MIHFAATCHIVMWTVIYVALEDTDNPPIESFRYKDVLRFRIFMRYKQFTQDIFPS